ncbi:MAG: hypothetical protein IJW27_07945 [Clostridia bacterium]|nr:hypothetical protein [Clostridia bacterium]
MPSKNKSLADSLEAILTSAASPEEEDGLKDLGIKVRRPTKLTVVLAALYKKAAGGDLSAIKELLLRLNPEDDADRKGVVFIDDIKNTDK